MNGNRSTTPTHIRSLQVAVRTNSTVLVLMLDLLSLNRILSLIYLNIIAVLPIYYTIVDWGLHRAPRGRFVIVYDDRGCS